MLPSFAMSNSSAQMRTPPGADTGMFLSSIRLSWSGFRPSEDWKDDGWMLIMIKSPVSDKLTRR